VNTSRPIIEMHDVDLEFSPGSGVFDMNLTVAPGTIFGLIGPSGCGKTTTVRLLTGLHRPQRGTVHVLDDVPHRFKTRSRKAIGYVTQQFVLYPNLTVRENLHFAASIYGVSYFKRRKRLREVLDFVELRDAQHRLGNKLSGGMQRRLSLACALVHNPRLLFADEPTAGIDPVLRAKFWEHFRQLRDHGRTLFITTQYIGEAVYCDLVGVMREGRLLHVDTPDNLRRKALGGETIKVGVPPEQSFEAIRRFTSHQAFKEVRRVPRAPGELYLTVEESGAAMPLVFETMRAGTEITVLHAEPYVPPFDDVFIALMEQAGAEQSIAVDNRN
jgi:ABC-2 type transport system ATP-binding protein